MPLSSAEVVEILKRARRNWLRFQIKVAFQHAGSLYEVGPCHSTEDADLLYRMFRAKAAGVEEGPAAIASFDEVVQQCCNLVQHADGPYFAHAAASLGHAATMQLLLKEVPEAATRTAGRDRHQPMHVAAKNGHAAVVQLLLEVVPEAAMAADGQFGGTMPWLPLHYAAQHGHHATAQLLLEAAPQAAMVAECSNGALPLHLAVEGGHLAVVRLLLEAAPQAAMVTGRGGLPLHLAAQRGHLAVFQLLLNAAPATATTATCDGRLPLHSAAEGGNPTVAQLLLDAAPAAAMMADEGGELPLHLSARYGPEVVPLLLDVAPEAAARPDRSGNQPLHLAARGGHAAAVQLLLDAAPAAATAEDSDGLLPLHRAAARGHPEMAGLLLDAAPAAAMAAAHWADLNEGEGGYLPLHYAAEDGCAALAQLLLEAAPAAAMVRECRDGALPLHVAARQGRAAAVQLLLDAAPAAATSLAAGCTPLQWAVARLVEMEEDFEEDDFLFEDVVRDLAACREAVRCLAAFGPAQPALEALVEAGGPALSLIADCMAAHLPLTDAQWQLVPAPCPGLGRALPAALGHSTAQAAQLVRRLPPADAQRLRTFALCLARTQRVTGLELSPGVAGRLMALFDC